MTSYEETLLPQLSLTCTEARLVFTQHIGMSQMRWQLIMLLSHGEMSHAVLQQRLALDGATLTRHVKQFEAEGVVSRRLDPQDNRFTLVSLTPSGQQVAAGLIATYQSFQGQLLDGISDADQQIVLRVLERLRTNIRGILVGESE